jgi:hypothetical protein
MKPTRCCSEFTQRFPPVQPRKIAWRSQPAQYRGPLGPVVVTIAGGITRIARHIRRERAAFYRFSTKPNWAGIRAAHAGAASVMPR